MECDTHLAATREDVDRVVVVLADDDAVGRRWLRQLVDLVAQGGDVFARLTQRVRQLLVLTDGLGQLTLRLEQPLLERVHATWGVGKPRSKVRDLVEEFRDLRGIRGVAAGINRWNVTVVRHGPNVHAVIRTMFARTRPCKLRTTNRTRELLLT